MRWGLIVSALPGGAADKAGGQYEHWWTARRIAEVLDGSASSIRLEPLGALGEATEFVVTQDDTMWAEQVKDHSSGGTWTIRKLEREHLLNAAKDHVDAGRQFRLVVSTASALKGLCARARAAETYEEFSEALNNEQAADLKRTAEHWEVTKEEAWPRLARIEVVQETRDSLRRLVQLHYRLLVAADPDIVIAAIRAYCDDHLYETITAPELWAHLDGKGFTRRHLVGDQNTLVRLHKTVERQQSRVDTVAPGIGLAPRADVDTLVELLTDPKGPQITVLDGAAGSGKSTVVAQVAAALEAVGWFVAVARMDAVDTTTNTSEKLGLSIGLTEAPVMLLAGVAAAEPALLIVDQLDAVSEYGGRMADNYESVAETLREADSFSNVRVLLVARSVDLETDSRLRRLTTHSVSVGRHTLGLLAVEDVRKLLSAAERPLPTAPETLELLRTPLHLSVYSRLEDTGPQSAYKTVQDLYDRYTTEFRSRVEKKVDHLDWSLVVGTMIPHMSDNELLVVPAAVMDVIGAAEVQALVSEGVLSFDGKFYSFFHESYFDYLFARGFVAAGRDLHEFLTHSGQALFRRAQTRQVLEHLAGTDRIQFLETVAEILASERIRYHLKGVVIEVLGGIEPSRADWQALEPIAFGETRIAARVRGLLALGGWFDAALDAGRWWQWLDDEDHTGLVYRELALAAYTRGPQVADLVRPHVDESDGWRLRVRNLVEWSLSPGLTDFAIELLEAGHLDEAGGRFNQDFWSFVYRLFQDCPLDAVRLTGAYLRRSLVRAAASGAVDPFEAQILTVNSQSSGVLADMAESSPRELVAELIDFVVTLATAEVSERDGQWPASRRWGLRWAESDHTVDDAIFNALDIALQRLGAEDPTLVDDVLRALDHPNRELRFLTCRTLTARGTADDAIRWLLEDPRNLVLGWADSPRWASRTLIETWSPTCSQELFVQLEAALLGHESPYETWEGTEHGKYELLSGLDPERISGAAKRKLGELQRRFVMAPPRAPEPIAAQFVGSPIGDDASTRMSDDDWIRALGKHTSTKTSWSGSAPVGGSRELAMVLGRRTAEDPVRFAHLGLRLDGTIPAAALDHLISNLPPDLDSDLLADVCEHARALHGEDVGSSICRVISKITNPTARLAQLVVDCSTDTNPDRELARTLAGSSDDLYYGGDLFMAGINSTRGMAALAAAHILFETDHHTEVLKPVVTALVNDSILSVRTCAAEAVTAMLNRDEAFAFDLAEALLGTPEVLEARTTERLAIYLIRLNPGRYAAFVADALTQTDAAAEHAGAVWAVGMLRDTLPEPLPRELTDLPPAGRRGAAKVLAHSAPVAIDYIIRLFDDPDDTVRDGACMVLDQLEDLDNDQVERLLRAFLASKAFVEHYKTALYRLEHMHELLPEVALDVCERVTADAGDEFGDIGTAAAGAGANLTTVVLRLYRQGGTELRARCLDLIDRLTELGAYGVGRQVDNER